MDPLPADYGLDAPGAIKRLALYGIGTLAVGQFAFFALRGVAPQAARAAFMIGIWTGGAFLFAVAVMIWSSRVGKLRLCRRLLDMVPWRGDEIVLDAGCGRGLALTRAAKRLTGGRAIGIDWWSQADLSDNKPEAALENARAEGVASKVEVRTGDLRELPFENASFDVVVSMTAVHNIRDAGERRRALAEMVRVLKPGGHLAVYDILHTGEYEKVLKELGMKEMRKSGWSLYWLMPGRRLCCRT